MNYKEWLAQAMADLAQKNPTENSKIDALVLLQHATGNHVRKSLLLMIPRLMKKCG